MMINQAIMIINQTFMWINQAILKINHDFKSSNHDDKSSHNDDNSSECDISVSKLLGFEIFPIFWMVSDSVSKKFGIEKSIGVGIGKKLVSKKYQIRYWKKFGIEKSIGFGIGYIWY